MSPRIKFALPIKTMQKIGVYLSSKSDLPAAYRKAAEDVGAWLGRTGRTLVYGGARISGYGVSQISVKPTCRYSPSKRPVVA